MNEDLGLMTAVSSARNAGALTAEQHAQAVEFLGAASPAQRMELAKLAGIDWRVLLPILLQLFPGTGLIWQILQAIIPFLTPKPNGGNGGGEIPHPVL